MDSPGRVKSRVNNRGFFKFGKIHFMVRLVVDKCWMSDNVGKLLNGISISKKEIWVNFTCKSAFLKLCF